jgi:tetratricopeptide (TPR) repeat protein
LFNALAENYQAMAGKETNNEQLRANYLKKAEEGYLEVIKIYPEHGGAYNNLGTLYASAGKLSEAETCLQKALNLGFISADSYYNLGAIYELSGKQELAMQYYHKCLGVSPNYAQAIERLNVITSNKQPTTPK